MKIYRSKQLLGPIARTRLKQRGVYVVKCLLTSATSSSIPEDLRVRARSRRDLSRARVCSRHSDARARANYISYPMYIHVRMTARARLFARAHFVASHVCQVMMEGTTPPLVNRARPHPKYPFIPELRELSLESSWKDQSPSGRSS